MTPGFWTQVAAVARRDLLRERRRGEVVWVTVPFGAIALLLVPLAVGTDQTLLRRIGPGFFWVVVMLFGVLVAVRRTAAETPAQRDATALLGLDPAAGFVGRTLASTLLLLVFEVTLGVVAVALYDLPLVAWPWLLLVVPLVAVGLAALGTLAGAIVASVDVGAALVPLLVTPMAIPLLLGATQSLAGLTVEGSILSWMLLMVIVVLVLTVVGVLSARPLQETR